MLDLTDGKLDEIKAFAATHPNGKSLDMCLQRLDEIAENNQWRCRIYADRAPMSLYFVFAKNTNIQMNGGIIYHGPHDGFGSGSAPTFSVTLDKSNGWRIHT
jgi:hypothetical protein